ncbi:UBP-type zinc finger domain-containing protein [soil metagenome]
MACEHFENVKPMSPNSAGCQACVALGDGRVHLRMCLVCGKVGCCDSSKNKHATAHFHASQHPVIQSFEPGETWGWCYVDEGIAKGLPPLRKLKRG